MNTGMIRSVVSLCLALYASAGWAKAQNLTVVSTNGTASTLNLSDINSIIFSNNNMQVQSSDCGDHYYSVFYTSQVSFDATAGLTEVPDSNPLFSISPNPADTKLTLRFKDGQQGEVLVYDAFGKQVALIPVNGEVQDVDVSGWASGMYLVLFGNQSLKFVKQ